LIELNDGMHEHENMLKKYLLVLLKEVLRRYCTKQIFIKKD